MVQAALVYVAFLVAFVLVVGLLLSAVVISELDDEPDPESFGGSADESVGESDPVGETTAEHELRLIYDGGGW